MRWRTLQRTGTGGAVALLIAALATGCGGNDGNEGDGAENQDRLTEPVTLKVATLPSLSLGVLTLADEMGYFADENITLQVESIQNSQDAVTLLARGELDAITGSLSVGLFNSIASGLDVRAVSAVSTIEEVPGVEEAPSGVFIRADLVDGDSATYADLRGRTIAMPGTVGTATSYLIALYCERGGFTLNDVTLENLSIADSRVALEQGAVEAAFLTSPFSTQALESGAAVEVGSAREVYGSETQAALMFGPTLLRDNQAAGVAFLRALLRAAADMQGDYRTNEEVVQALSTGLDIPVETITSAPPYHVPADLAMNPDTIEKFQEIFFELDPGLFNYDEPLPLDQVLDDSLRQRALDSM